MKAIRHRLRPATGPQTARRFTPARLILAATAVAAAEVGLGLGAGFFAVGRAEPLIFLAVRPWILLFASALIGAYPLRQRATVIGLGLILATASELLLITSLGALHPWPLTLRGLVAGLLVAAMLNFAFAQARDFFGRGSAVGILLPLAALFLYPGGLRGYDALILGKARPVEHRPDLMLMTGLPVIWGEGGAFDPQSRPAAFHSMLQREFRVRAIDTIDERGLATGRLLLLAQPRALAPEELVAVDAWVRSGGKVLVLQDPALLWPTRLPLGDLRRPPPVGLLGPLLDHWGIEVQRRVETRVTAAEIDVGDTLRRLLLPAPGRVVIHSPACAAMQHWLARCRIGRGEALILADADLIRDALWVGSGQDGTSRHHRLSDNAVAIAELLDLLSGTDRSRARGRVDWLPLEPVRLPAMLAAMFPLLLSTVLAAILRRRS